MKRGNIKLDNPINWAENNPAFNKLTPTQRQEFADLAVKKLGNNPTTYDVNQLFDPFYKNARKENGLALFNSEENQGFLNKLGIKDYTSMKGTLANDGEHSYTLSNTTGLPHNEKITLNASGIFKSSFIASKNLVSYSSIILLSTSIFPAFLCFK